MSWGAAIPNATPPHTRDNTLDDLETIVDDLETNVSKIRIFSKLEGKSYIRLGVTPIPLPEYEVQSPPKKDRDRDKDTSSPPTPLLNHSYDKHHQTYESNDIAFTYDMLLSEENNTNREKHARSALSIDTITRSLLLFDWAPKATMLSSIINLCNSIVGAGVLSLPYAGSHVGWIAAIILLVVCAIVSGFTFQLQSSAGIIYNNSTQSLSSSYYTVSKATVPQLKLLSDIVIIVSCIGVQTAYLVIIGDLLPDVAIHIFGNDTLNVLKERRFWIGIYMILFIIPSTLLRKLDTLRFTSSFAVICFTFIAIIMFIYLFDDTVNLCNDTTQCGIMPFVEFENPTDIKGFFKAIPIYLLAFGAQPLSFSVTNELLNSTFSRMNIVSISSFIITAIFYIMIGSVGYFTFGENVSSNILTDYPSDGILVSLIRISLSIAVAFSYPVVNTPGRHSVSTIFFKANASQISNIKFYILSICIMLITFIISMIVDDLGIVLGVIGSTASAACVLVLPGLYYYYIEKKTDGIAINQRSQCCSKLNTYGSIVTLIMGVILIPFCVIVLFIE